MVNSFNGSLMFQPSFRWVWRVFPSRFVPQVCKGVQGIGCLGIVARWALCPECEGDALPGLVVDRYADCVVIQPSPSQAVILFECTMLPRSFFSGIALQIQPSRQLGQ